MRRRQGILVLLFSASLKLPSKMGFKEFLLLLSRSLSLQIKSLQRLEAGMETWFQCPDNDEQDVKDGR